MTTAANTMTAHQGPPGSTCEGCGTGMIGTPPPEPPYLCETCEERGPENHAVKIPKVKLPLSAAVDAMIRKLVPIAEVVGERVMLSYVGGGAFRGQCPFCEHKTRSFNVSRGLFYCFSCQEGGDVITFVAKTGAVSAKRARKILARRAAADDPARLYPMGS